MKANLIRAMMAVIFVGALSAAVIQPWGKTDVQAVDEKTNQVDIQGEFMDFVSNEDSDFTSLYKQNLNVKKTVSEDGEDAIVIEGKDAAISESEIEQYQKFYELHNQDDAYDKSVQLAEERHAMYLAALKNGYKVTDDEVSRYLEQLKKELGESLSEDELDKIYSEYGSEDEYWEYEKKVYRIDLPIQKYAASLEEEFKMKNGKNISADLLQEKWDQESIPTTLTLDPRTLMSLN